MIRKFRRGYVEKDINGYTVVISKVTQSDDFGTWEDEDEEELRRYSGYHSKAEATEDLKNHFRVKEIIIEE